MSYRYYSTQRPIGPGTFPRPEDNDLLCFENFDTREYVPEIGRDAWGYLEYENPLAEKDARDYELTSATPAPAREFSFRRDRSGALFADETGEILARAKEDGTVLFSEGKVTEEEKKQIRATARELFGNPDTPDNTVHRKLHL